MAARKSDRETEVKLPVRDLKALRRRLKELGARRLGSVYEHNVVFDTPKALLRRKGCLLRLRLESSPNSPRTPLRAVLTYKGPVAGAASRGAEEDWGFLEEPAGGRVTRYKVREELETTVSHPARLEGILRCLGLRPVFRYEKFRTTYRLPGLRGLSVDLDQTPLGPFLELEGTPKAIDLAGRRLGYRPRDYIVSSYGALYFDFCRRQGLRPTHMLFPGEKN